MRDQSYDVVVRSEGEDHFTAQVVAFPQLKAEAATEAEAVDKLKDSLEEFLEKSKLIKVSVKGGNPWLAVAGHAADDPDFDIYLEEIRKYRMEQDARMSEDE
jgi:predicted RNase H-like HicB family nuclease